tara:strand:- start:93 stop:563 length:471 start_codon:yes stop_codon:yes gene_type:complete
LRNKPNIAFIDIDNTIADTSNFLKRNGNLNSSIDYLNIDVLVGSRNFIKEKFKDTHKLIFLTHRKLSIKKVTRKWLIKNNFMENNSELFLVANPLDKIHYFKAALLSGCNISILDDLSYNHENDNIIFYKDVINFIKENKLNYFDYSFIMHLNSNN